MNMENLTERQQRILDFIAERLDDKGYPPSIREIADASGIKSTRGVTINLDALERAGYLIRDRNARGIKLVSRTERMDSRMLPLMGSIAAGPPILADERVESVIPVPESLAPDTGDAIVLRVRGESMTGEGIHDGDMVVVRRQPSADNGDLTAVMIDGEATVKRFFRDSEDIIRLEPSNPAFDAITVSLKDSQAIIVGKVVGLLRSYR